MYIKIYIYIYVCVCVWYILPIGNALIMCVSVYMRACLYVSVCVSVYVCVLVCVCVTRKYLKRVYIASLCLY